VGETQVRDQSNEILSSTCIASGGFSIVESEIHDRDFVSVLCFGGILRVKL